MPASRVRVFTEITDTLRAQFLYVTTSEVAKVNLTDRSAFKEKKIRKRQSKSEKTQKERLSLFVFNDHTPSTE